MSFVSDKVVLPLDLTVPPFTHDLSGDETEVEDIAYAYLNGTFTTRPVSDCG